MAVYTKLSNSKAEKILAQYGFNQLDDIQGISEGILNTNYLIKGDKGKFILRILEGERDQVEEEKELNLLKDLNANNFPCPCPISTLDNKLFYNYEGKLLSVFSFIEGDKPTKIGSPEIIEIGKALATFHNFSKGKSLERIKKIDLDYFYDKIKDADLKSIIGEDYDTIMGYYDRASNVDYSHLPTGIIHNDIFPDNVFFKGDKISGMIDFNDSMTAPFIFDLAIIINFWIRDRVEDLATQEKLIKEFLDSYNKVRPLSEDEMALLDEAILRSVLTFVFLRILKFHVEDNEGVEMEVKDFRALLKLLKYIK